MRDYLKNKLGVPENWDKYDYQTQRYSFEDIEEILQTYKNEQLRIGCVVGRSEQLCVECKSATTPMPDMMCEPCYKAKTNR